MLTLGKTMILFGGVFTLAGCANWREAWERTGPVSDAAPVTQRDLLYRSQESSLFFWPAQLAPPPGYDAWGSLYPDSGEPSADWLSRDWPHSTGDNNR